MEAVPGVYRLKDGSKIFHRTHLPLIGIDFAGDPSEAARVEHLMLWPFLDGSKPREHQLSACAFMRARSATLIADEMRLGKTGAVIAAHNESDGPFVVCAPLNTRRVWLRWMAKRWPDEEVGVIEGVNYDPDFKSKKLVFIHPELLSTHGALGAWKPGTFVLDEAHKYSNPRADRTKGAQLLAANAKKVVAVTGTPVWNTPASIYSILSMMSPGAWGSWKDFVVRYCAGEIGPWGTEAKGISNNDEFRKRLSELMIARSWDDVGENMPKPDRRAVLVELSDDDREDIDIAAQSVRGDDGLSSIEHLGALRRALATRKVPKAVVAAEAIQDAGERCVVWVWHKHIADNIKRALKNAYVVHGTLPVKKREAVFDAWEADPIGVLCITLAVGEVGIDLSAARHAIFAELDWIPATIAQAEMRTFHPSRAMRIMYLAADHPVDLAIVKALEEKANSAKTFGVPAPAEGINVLASSLGLETSRPNMDRMMAAVLGRKA